MIVEVRLCINTQYFRCSAKVGRNIHKFQSEFFKWLYNRENNHPYWELAHVDENGNKFYGVCYDTEAFVYWLNDVRFKKGKKVAKLIETPNIPPRKKINF